MSKGGKKKRSTAGLILDVILTLCTGGLWLIVSVFFYALFCARKKHALL